MKQTITLQNKVIEYELTHKAVKNINLRIRGDGTMTVSANSRTPQAVIDAFLRSKENAILRALSACEKQKAQPAYAHFTEQETMDLVLALCQKVYPLFAARGVAQPQIKFRKMTSCWGNCRKTQGVITFNKQLCYAPPECIRYVVLHEFCHLLQANHSPKFYEELATLCPDWKMLRQRLKEVRIP